jgi:hypothetical protein
MPDSKPLPVTFASFVVSLGGTAMENLGLGPSGQKDLELARQTIDLLVLLKEKTTGNLDGEEGKLLDSLIFELQSKWVEVSGEETSA